MPHRSCTFNAFVLTVAGLGVCAVPRPGGAAETAASRLRVGDPVRIEVYPLRVTLPTRRQRTQLVVTGYYHNGDVRDLTQQAQFTPDREEVVEVRSAVAAPIGNGLAVIRVSVGDHVQRIPVEVRGQEAPDPVRFKYETLAVLTKQGCNAGSCHGSPRGKGGFALSLLAFDPTLDAKSLTQGDWNRRTNVIDPWESLMLKKPMLRISHGGGKRLGKDDVGFRILHAWIHEGARPDPPDAPTCTGITVHPSPGRVLRFPDAHQQLSVRARFSDGSTRDVTRIASYTSSNPAVATVDAHGLVRGLERGQAAVSIRYLEALESVYLTLVKDIPGFAWTSPEEYNYVDRRVNAKLRQLQYVPSKRCSDEVFLRRVYLDLTGLLPPVDRVRSFPADPSPTRRPEMIEHLLADPAHARFWALKMNDLLRVTPARLPGGRAELYGEWITRTVAENVPFDRVVRTLLTATGPTSEVPAANYFRTANDTPTVTETTTQLFMGSRIECAKCHNHPFESWTQDDYYRIAAVFARVRRIVPDRDKKANNPAMRIALSLDGEVTHPRSGKRMRPWPVDGAPTADATERRTRFANWLTAPTNPYFARVEVNRIWAHLMGRGIVEPVDDFRSSNPPSNVELLEALAQDFLRSGYDRKHIVRTIVSSHTYQRSNAPHALNASDDTLFSHARPRMLTAEQMHDAILRVVEPAQDRSARSRYATQQIHPKQTEFLRAFGQPARQTACPCERGGEPTLPQMLQLMNGEQVLEQIRRHAYLRYRNAEDPVGDLYAAAFSRSPSPRERRHAETYLAARGRGRSAFEDLVWAVVNTKEFLFQH